MGYSIPLSATRSIPRSVNNICNTWNIPEMLVQNSLCENSHSIWSVNYDGGCKSVLHSASHHLREFFTNPSRARHLYQRFWTLRVRKCQDAICQVIESIDLVEEPEDPSCDFRLACGIREYFEQNRGISTSSTGILDLQDIEGVAPHIALQHFLEFLSNVSWAEVFLKTEASTMMTLVIASWLCDYLVSDQ